VEGGPGTERWRMKDKKQGWRKRNGGEGEKEVKT